jgi:hypothetical protein
MFLLTPGCRPLPTATGDSDSYHHENPISLLGPCPFQGFAILMLNFGIPLAGKVIDQLQLRLVSVGQFILKFITFCTSSHLTRKSTAFVLFTLLAFADVSTVPTEYRAEKTKAVLGTVESSLKITQLICVAV